MPDSRGVTGLQLLECPMDPDRNPNGAETVRGFLIGTLHRIHQEGYAYDGKYAFEGRWKYMMLEAFVDAGFMAGDWEFEGFHKFSVENYDTETLDTLITRAINAIHPAAQN